MPQFEGRLPPSADRLRFLVICKRSRRRIRANRACSWSGWVNRVGLAALREVRSCLNRCLAGHHRHLRLRAKSGSASVGFPSQGIRLPASGLAVSSAQSMNSRRAGLGVRPFSVMIPIGHICVGISTGKTFIDSRLALKCSIDAGRKLRKRSDDNNADCMRIAGSTRSTGNRARSGRRRAVSQLMISALFSVSSALARHRHWKSSRSRISVAQSALRRELRVRITKTHP